MRTVDPARFKAKKRDILRAAAICFQRDGLRGASIAAICREAKMSAGHLYHYFASKERIVEEMSELYLETLSREADAPARDIGDFLTAEIAHAQVDGAGDCVVLLDLVAEAQRNPALERILRESTTATARIVEGLIANWQSAHAIHPTIDPATAALAIIAVLDGAIMLPLRAPDPRLDSVRALLVHMVTQGLASPHERAADQ